jgi:DNA-binding NarL/FixJ family response regulator
MIINFVRMQSIAISIVEDLQEVVNILGREINQQPDMLLLSTYLNAEDAINGLPDMQADIVIMDINLPGMSGIECIRKIKQQCPHTQFMMFTIYDNTEQVFEALMAGAAGYLLKKTPVDQIVGSIRELHQGGSPMSTNIARKVIARLQNGNTESPQQPDAPWHLTPKEKELLELLAKGLLYKEIATRLQVTSGTIRQYIHRIYEKLHVQNRTEAINKYRGF